MKCELRLVAKEKKQAKRWRYYSTTFLSSFLFLISKIIRIKRKVKNEKWKNKNTNKKILTYRFGLFLFGAGGGGRTLMKLPSRGRRVNKTTQWVVFSQSQGATCSRSGSDRSWSPKGLKIPPTKRKVKNEKIRNKSTNKKIILQFVRIIFVWCRWRGSNPHEVALEGFWVPCVCHSATPAYLVLL